MACWWLEEYASGIEARECAYRLYRARDDMLGAARMAIWLSHDYAEYRGETAVANGWLRRGERLLEKLPLSPEHALLAQINAHNALMGLRDPVEARRLSAEAAEIARKVGPADIEMLGIALEGLAMVNAGEVAQGMSRLDEATAAALSGELNDPTLVGTACCYLIRACEQVHDYDRAAQWCHRVREFSRRWNLTGLFSACRIQYAGLLTIRGAWTEAEQEIEALHRHVQQVQPRLVPIAQIRLADLRRRQGRWEEAEDLLAKSGAHLLAVLGRAQLAHDRGDMGVAAELAEEYLRRVPTADRTERVPGLDVLARARTSEGSLDPARAAISELRTVAEIVGTEPLQAIVAHAEGCLLAAEGNHEAACERLETSASLFERNETPFEAARSRLQLAQSLNRLGRREPASLALEDAHSTLDKLGAARPARTPTPPETKTARPSVPLLFQIQDALVGHYSIQRELGKGGMATVYLARDLRHDRLVALKVMRPDLASSVGPERFLHEIRITAQLRHPRILPVFDSGEAAGQLWYTMPFVEGETLRQRLVRERTMDVEDAVRIICEVASALDYAHRRSVVHRDVKPENIMIEEQHAVIADFGVARALDKAAGEGLTATGFAVGTPAYMSPEEASGVQAVDGRADVYALGCVLYEMLAGGPPYTGTPKAVIAQRLHSPPPAISHRRAGVPRWLSQAIAKSMAIDPNDRFKTAGEFAEALSNPAHSGSWLPRPASRLPSRALLLTSVAVLLGGTSFALWRNGWSGPTKTVAAAPLNIAVLPFANNGRPEDEYFADGVADEIRGQLARLPSLQVISSASAEQFRDSAGLQAVARQLGAAYLLTGKVRRELASGRPGRVQLSSELIQVSQVPAPVTRWQRVYDTVSTALPRLQSSIAREVAEVLGLHGQRQEQTAGLDQRRPEAYEAYLRGQQILRQGASGPGELRQAIAEFQAAVDQDSMFAAAWAQLGWAEAALWNNASTDETLLENAKAHGDRALRIGGAEAEARQVLAFYHIMKGNRGAAREETRKGLEADPSNARLVGYSASLLELEGRWQEALRFRQRAATLDPTAAGHAAGLATNLLWLRRYGDARRAADRYLILGPTNPEAYQLRAMVALGEGKLEEARRFIRTGAAQIPPEELLPFVATYWDLDRLLDQDQQAQVLRMGPAQFYGDTVWWQTASAAIHLDQGDTATARRDAGAARDRLSRQLKTTPEDAHTHSRLALVDAYLGRRDEATREAERSISLLPIAKDALNGALLVYRLACVQSRLGLQSEALATLGTLLSVPFYVSPAWLRIDPNFSVLRNNPEFRKLTETQLSP